MKTWYIEIGGEGERVYCHQDNFLRGCVQCVENHKKNIVVSDIIELLTNSSTLEDERSDYLSPKENK